MPEGTPFIGEFKQKAENRFLCFIEVRLMNEDANGN